MKTSFLMLALPALFLAFALEALGQINSPGRAIRFAGGAYGSSGAHFIDTNKSFTVEFWLHRERSNAVDNVVTLGTGSASNRVLRIGFRADNRFVFGFNSNDLVTATGYADTNWNHWACVFNSGSGNRRILLNGVPVATDTAAGGLAAEGKFTIASDNGFATNNLVRATDEIRIWNLPRTDAEIATNRHRAVLTSTSGLLGHYRCDSISGGATPDSSSRNVSLEIFNGSSLIGSGITFFPEPVTLSVSEVEMDSLRLNGSVQPYGATGAAWFAWGPSAGSLTNLTPPSPVGGTNVMPISVGLSNLAAGSSWTARVLASNSVGVVTGAVVQFRTGGSTLTVATLGDTGAGSLRSAVLQALPGDVVQFSVTGRLYLTSGQLVLPRGVTLAGPGAGLLEINASELSRHIAVTNGTAAVSGVTLSDGRALGGGSVWIGPGAGLVMDRSVIRNSYDSGSSEGGGGGVLCQGTLVMRDTQLSSNRSASASGGGLAVVNGSAFVTNCAFVANQARFDGGVHNGAGPADSTVALVNCTVSGNIADQTGGGIGNRRLAPGTSFSADMFLQHATIASNSAPSGGGGVYNGDVVAASLSILAGNRPQNWFTTAQGTNDTTDLMSSDASIGNFQNTNPQLLPLADKGGFTPVHAILFGSPALNLGSGTTSPSYDQRGWPRDAAPDLGASEYLPTYGGAFTSNGTWNTYAVVFRSAPWPAAHEATGRASLRGVTGHLVAITSEAENTFVQGLALRHGMSPWIGLTDNEAYGGIEAGTNPLTGWVWTSGENNSYRHFAAIEPNDSGSGGEDFVQLRSYTGEWNDLPTQTVVPGWVMEFETQTPSPDVVLTGEKAALPPGVLAPGLTGRRNAFDAAEWRNLPIYTDTRDFADYLAANPVQPTTGLAPVINFTDPDSPSPIGILTNRSPFLTDVLGVNDEIIVAIYKGRIVVPEGRGGLWTFGVHSDDGFALRIRGRTWLRSYGSGWVDPVDPTILTFRYPVGDSDTRGVIDIAPGEYDIEMLAYERGGAASWELYAAQGDFPSDTSTTTWRAVGDPLGLALAGPWGTGSALSFSGSDAVVTIPHSERFNGLPLTITAWIRTTQNTDVETGLVGKYIVSSGNGYQMFLQNGRLRAWYFSGNGFTQVFSTDGLFNGGFVADGSWHYVAMVIDDKGGSLHVDGRLQASLAWNLADGAGRANTTAPLLIGRYGTNSFRGQMDEVAIWNRALTQDEILDRMFVPPAKSDEGLIASYRFQESLGGIVLDSGANKLDGIPSGDVARIPSSIGERYSMANTSDLGAESLRNHIANTPGSTLALGEEFYEISGGTISVTNSVRLEGGRNFGVIGRNVSAIFGLFHVHPGAHLQLNSIYLTSGRSPVNGGAVRCGGIFTASGSTISNNRAESYGGGIHVDESGWFHLRDCIFSSNMTVGSDGRGGGLAVQGQGVVERCAFINNTGNNGDAVCFFSEFSAALEIRSSTIRNNTGTFRGGGILATTEGIFPGVLRVHNTTITANSATFGAGLACDTGVELVHCTVAKNNSASDGGGIQSSGPGPVLVNTLVAGNRRTSPSQPSDVAGAMTLAGGNLVETVTGGIFDETGTNILSMPAGLGVTSFSGKQTGFLLPADSPARNAGTNIGNNYGNLPFDQFGKTRVRGSAPDAGSLEFAFPSARVTTLADDGPGSLREAVGEVAAGGVVDFDTNLMGQSITLTNGQLLLSSPVEIRGLGAANLVIRSGGEWRLFEVRHPENSIRSVIQDVTLADGVADGSDERGGGGAIRNVSALRIARCILTNNVAENRGGAIVNGVAVVPPVLEVLDSTFVGNRVLSFGRGNAVSQGENSFAETLSAGTSRLTRCTFTRNLPASADIGSNIRGGALAVNSGQMELEQCTISGNAADAGGGISVDGGKLELRNTLLAANVAGESGQDIERTPDGLVQSRGHNLIGDATGEASGSFTNLVRWDRIGSSAFPINPRLLALANNGGPVPTMALQSASVARNAGNSTNAGIFDQRGFPRRSGPGVDIGAYELLAPLPLAIDTKPDGGIRLRLSGQEGYPWTIIGSTNLFAPRSSWPKLGTATETTPGNFEFIPPSAPTNAPAAFYSIRIP